MGCNIFIMEWEGQKCRAGCAPEEDCWYEQQFNEERGKLFGLWAVFLTEMQKEDIWGLVRSASK